MILSESPEKRKQVWYHGPMRVRNRLVEIFIQHMMPLVLVVLVLGVSATVGSRVFTRRSSRAMAERMLQEAIAYYDNILDEMDSLTLMFGQNQELLDRLKQIQTQAGRRSLDFDAYQELKLILSVLSAPANSHPYISDILLYADNPGGMVVSSSSSVSFPVSLEETPWYAWWRDGGTQQAITTAHEGAAIRFLRRFTSASRAMSGVIVLDLNASWLAQAYTKEPGCLVVRDGSGNLLFRTGADPKEAEAFVRQGSKYGLTYAYLLDKRSLYAVSRMLAWMTAVLTLLSIIMGMVLTFGINRQERKFLGMVLKQFRKVGDDVHVEDVPVSQNVFEYLTYHVVKTFLEKDYMAWQREALEYRSLQMQINPHFLFNTLDTINWKAIELGKGENEVSTMIQLLSKLLSYSLSSDFRKGVPLSRELEETGYYLQIQRIRFKDRYRYRDEIDPSLLGLPIPAMILQPMLENSFNHGFAPGRVLAISLSVRREGERVVIVVANDGLPMDRATLEKLNGDGGNVVMRKTSLGLMNIKKRLSLFTAGLSTMRVESDGVRGVRIVITLPYAQSAAGGEVV